ncbi:MAG TPA: response regulator transcription factor [Vicingaceae bacterium]
MINVLLVDDNALVRKAIKTILENHPAIQVIGECQDGEEVIPFVQCQQPDVILMDNSMPVLNGIKATKLVRHLFPEIKVIGLSCDDDEVTKNAFLENGAVGFLSKYETTNEKLVLKINTCCLMV